MNTINNSCGYIKLDGEGVEDGKIDLTQATSFLNGIDESLRFFIEKESVNYTEYDYSLEVKIEPGSIWVLILGIAGLTGTAFLSSAAAQLGKNMVGEKKPSDVLKNSVKKMQSTVKIAKHLGGMDKKKVESTRFKDNNRLIGIPNNKGQYLYVTREEFDTFFSAPRGLYENITKPVNENVALKIGVKEADGSFTEESINQEDRPIFSGEKADDSGDEVVLPELKDGKYVELEGELTRGNGRTNTFGFAYKGHIITCTLRDGRVKDYKQALFDKVQITGEVTRHYEVTTRAEEKKKPKIIIDTIKDLEDSGSQISLV